MISTELLRRYSFFAGLEGDELRTVAMLTEEDSRPAGTVLFQEGARADTLYLLMEGGADLFFGVVEEQRPDAFREFNAGEVNPGELLGISALIEPYQYSTTARISCDCKFLTIDAARLRPLLLENPRLGYRFMYQVAKSAMARLGNARVQLAAS
jgi:CRP-like cAMP-binding protein